MRDRWPPKPLGNVLEPVVRRVSTEPTTEYRLLGVRLEGEGPFLRETKLGAQISASSLNEVKAGDFIYSRLFAWRGSFGIINDELDGCYVSNEFPLFRPINDQIDIRFLNYWFRLRSVINTVEADCSGSTPLTRNRYKEEFFLRLEIPLPPLSEQRRIVAKIEQLAAKIENAMQLHDAIDKSCALMLRSTFRQITKDSKRSRMSEIAPLIRRPVKIRLEENYPELGIRSFGKGTFHKAPLKGSDVGSKKLFWIHPGDLIFNNVFAWEGAVAVAEEKDQGRVGSHRFITRAPISEKATANFLRFYFFTNEGLAKLGEASPGGAGRNRTLGLNKLDEIEVPIPSLERQLWFDSLQAQVDRLKALQAQTAAELEALLPSILDQAFKGEL